MRILLFILTIAISCTMSYGQTEYTMKGYLRTDDQEKFDYKLVFSVSGNTIRGHSVTKLPEGYDMQAKINGHFDPQSHTLTFKEAPMPNMPKIENACYFNVKLTYKTEENHYSFSGTFAGKDINSAKCEQGTVTFEVPMANASIFETKPKRDTPAAAGLQHDSEMKITATNSKEFEWHTDSCIIEIWDGEVVDGDVITLLVNGVPAFTNYRLAAAKRRLRLFLPQKVNTISILAENEGSAPPNTSQITIVDGGLQYSMTSRLKNGEKANIVLRKK